MAKAGKRGGFGIKQTFKLPIKNRAKFVKKHSVPSVKRLIKSADR